MKKIKIIAETFVSGKVMKVSDKTVPLDDKMAATLVANYKAEYVEDEKASDGTPKKETKKKDKEDKS